MEGQHLSAPLLAYLMDADAKCFLRNLKVISILSPDNLCALAYPVGRL